MFLGHWWCGAVIIPMCVSAYTARSHKGWALRVMPFYSNSLACILDIQFSRTFYEGPFPIRAARWLRDLVCGLSVIHSAELSSFPFPYYECYKSCPKWERERKSIALPRDVKAIALRHSKMAPFVFTKTDDWRKKIALFKSRSILKGAIYMCH